jgi:hypothetical protein
MTSCKFFTILKTYLHCCNTREDLVAVHKKNEYCIENSDEEMISENISGQVKLSDQMGYLSSVDEARKNLEDIFKNHKES